LGIYVFKKGYSVMNYLAGFLGGFCLSFLCVGIHLSNLVFPTTGIVTEISSTKITVNDKAQYSPIPGTCLGDTVVMEVHKKVVVK